MRSLPITGPATCLSWRTEACPGVMWRVSGSFFSRRTPARSRLLRATRGAQAILSEDGCNGLRVDGSDPATIAKAILRLAENPDLCRQMGGAGRRVVEERYTWDRVAACIQALTEAVAAGRGPTSGDYPAGEGEAG